MPDDSASYRQRFLMAYGTLDLEAAQARYRAIVGTDDFPDTPEGKLAASAIKKLKSGDEDGPSPPELAALEYLIRLVRPAPFFRNGKPDTLDTREFQTAFPDWEAFRPLTPPWVYAVGRIERDKDNPAGTGFLVSDRHLVTNNHVLDFVSFGVRKIAKGQASIRFQWEYECPPTEGPIDILNVIASHPTLDVCILEIAPIDMRLRVPLKVAPALPEIHTAVVAIGYPFNDSTRNPLFIPEIFGNSFGVKRGAPGYVTAVQSSASAFFHDCSTLGGNSGSPLVSMHDGTVYGVHCGGGFLWRNQAVDCVALSKFVASI
jgi:S1-C subfamily serine protease